MQDSKVNPVFFEDLGIASKVAIVLDELEIASHGKHRGFNANPRRFLADMVAKLSSAQQDLNRL